MASYEQLALTGPGPKVLQGEEADKVLQGGQFFRGYCGWSIEECKRAYVKRYSRDPAYLLVGPNAVTLAGPIPTKAVTDEKRQDSI